ncbi:hypothetical protein E4U42_001894 [Claviceps africana]|uniref:Uncharacterized protein n=1 Tax=Claviceps africana TaxID=83212 RepID=A0A8K0JA74_9HYPO|nr:hypothetical protein E4U42_001894 [Claviceps africana]
MSPSFLETLLAGPGSERVVGARVWGLLRGLDPTGVGISGNIPSKISIEDTFRGLETLSQITEELFRLSCSLIRRLSRSLDIWTNVRTWRERKNGLLSQKRSGWVSALSRLIRALFALPKTFVACLGPDCC